MSEIRHSLAALRRPRLLVRAARVASARYSRSRHLAALMAEAPGQAADAFTWLMTREGEMEEMRKAGSAEYMAARHVQLLAALLAEAARDDEEPRAA